MRYFFYVVGDQPPDKMICEYFRLISKEQCIQYAQRLFPTMTYRELKSAISARQDSLIKPNGTTSIHVEIYYGDQDSLDDIAELCTLRAEKHYRQNGITGELVERWRDGIWNGNPPTRLYYPKIV